MSSEKRNQSPPDGGWLAWTQVLASFFMAMCSLGLSNSFGVFQSHYQEHRLSDYSPATIAWIGTTQGFLINLVGLLSGRLYDSGYIKSLLYGGIGFSVVGLVTASFATTYWATFLSLGVCVGFGSGLFYVPSLAIVALYFSRRRPLATSISATGGSVGGIVYPLLFRVLVDALGFPWTCRIFACINGTLLVVSCLLITTRDCQSATKRMSMFDSTTLRDIPFILFSVALLLILLGVDVPFFYLPAFVRKDLGLSAAMGNYLLAALNGSSIFGRVLIGLIATHINTFYVWEASIAGSCIILISWAFVHDLAGIITFVVIYGFFTGGVTSLISPALLVISSDLSLVGTRLGMSGVLAGVGFLIGPPIAGVIDETHGGHTGLSLFAAVTYFTALAVLVVVYWLHRRRGPTSADDSEQPSTGVSQESVVTFPDTQRRSQDTVVAEAPHSDKLTQDSCYKESG